MSTFEQNWSEGLATKQKAVNVSDWIFKRGLNSFLIRKRFSNHFRKYYLPKHYTFLHIWNQITQLKYNIKRSMHIDLMPLKLMDFFCLSYWKKTKYEFLMSLACWSQTHCLKWVSSIKRTRNILFFDAVLHSFSWGIIMVHILKSVVLFFLDLWIRVKRVPPI